MWMRIRRIPGVNPVGNATFVVQYRVHIFDNWATIGGNCPESSLPGKSLDAAFQRLGAVTLNTNANFAATTYMDDMNVYGTVCQNGGQTRFATTSPVTVGGLTPAGTYSFRIMTGQPSQVGLPNVFTNTVPLLPTPTYTPKNWTLDTVTKPTSAVRMTGQGAQNPNVAINGNWPNSANYFQSTGTCGDYGCYWQVDLGIVADIVYVSIQNRYDSDAAAQANAGLLVYVSVEGGNRYLPTGHACQAMPASLYSSTLQYTGTPYYADVPCFSPHGQDWISGRYVTIVAPIGQTLSLSQVWVYAGDTCPSYLGANGVAVSGNCAAGAAYGSVCTSICPNDYFMVSGAPQTSCRGLTWDAPPLVCHPRCPTLSPPANVGACTQSLVTEMFDPLPDGSLIGRWFSPDPSEAIGIAWFTTDGYLQAGGVWSCMEELFLVVGDKEVQNFVGDYEMTVDVFTEDRAGITRLIDEDNFVRFYLDFNTDMHVLDSVVNGVYHQLSDVYLKLLPHTWYRVTWKQTGTTLRISIDGRIVITTTFTALTAGYMGVYSGTIATFDHFAVTTSCVTCQNSAPQDTCTFQCNPGWIAVGNATAVCTMSADGKSANWAQAAPLQCVLAPPVFKASTRYVPELSARGTDVGLPLVAYIADPIATTMYQIVSGPINAQTGAPIFAIDGCSGQLWVNSNPLPSYATASSYTLVVSVSIVGHDVAPSNATVTVLVTRVSSAPIIATGVVLNVSAAATVGTRVGQIPFTSASNGTVVFSTVVDGSSGVLGITNTSTGVLSVISTAGLDYYTGKKQYLMQVQAKDPVTLLVGSGIVTVNVLEAPTPPYIAPGQIIPIPWVTGLGTVATPGQPASIPVSATLEANTYNSALYKTTMAYSLIPYPAALSVCGINATNNGTNVSIPTTTGVAGAQSLFAIAPATGIISVAAAPTVPWQSRTPVALDGYFALASYKVCVNVSTGLNRWAVAPVTVATTTAVEGLAMAITSYRLATGPVAGAAGLIIDTVVPTQVFFNGVGFSGVVSTNTSGTVKANYTNGVYNYVATGCYVLNITTITCTTVPGIGATLKWSIYIAGTIVPASIELHTSYAMPIVTSITNNTGLLSAGGNSIVLNGRYFGMNGGGVLTYGPASNPTLYSCTLATPAWKAPGVGTDSQSACIAKPGAGVGLTWSLNVGGQIVTGTAAQTLSYAAPKVTSVAVAGAGNGTNATLALANLPTIGGTTLIVTGTNFGGNTANVIAVSYSANKAGALTYTASCARSPATSTTTLQCVTVPGVGSNLAITVSIEGQSSGATNITGFGYAPPVITSVSGGQNMLTSGGDALVITGTGFGPGQPSPDWVRYGLVTGGATGPTKYAALKCAVVAVDTQITCVTAPGTGGSTPYSLQVSVGGQSSAVFAANIFYAPPMITSFVPVGGLQTSGGQQVQLNGLNFGPGGDPSVVITATYSTRGAGRGGSSLSFTATGCTLTAPNAQITCTSAPGGGSALSWAVNVDGQRSVNPTTSYAAPSISKIAYAATGLEATDMLSPNVGTTLSIIGANFGFNNTAHLTGTLPNITTSYDDLITSITYGPSGVEYNATSWTHVSDTRIDVVVGPATGTSCFFRVTVAGQVNDIPGAVFNFASPLIKWISPNHGPTFNPPGNATVITLGITDPPVFDPLYDLMVRIGTGSTWATVRPVVPLTPADLAKATNPDGTISIRFTLPREWAGTDLGVQLVPVGAGNTSSPSPLTNLTEFSYDAPLVSEVFVLPASFSAGNNATFGQLGTRFLVTPACPWDPTNPTWSCLPAATNPHGQLYLTVLYGKNFGANPARCANGARLRSCADPVTRHLDYLSPATNVTPAPAWTEASWVTPGVVDAAPATVVYWSDSIIAAYSYAPTASLSVRLTNIDVFGVPEAVASAPWTYATGKQPVVLGFSVGGVAATQGLAVNAPTAGGVPLAVTIAGPAGAAGQYVIEVDSTVCPNVGNAVCGAASCVYTCTLPAGQGSTNLVRVIDTTVGYQYQALAGVISYAGPVITDFQTWQYYPSSLWPSATTPGWVTAPLTGTGVFVAPIVYMPTNGSLLMVDGRNLGTMPALIINSGTPSQGSQRQVVVGGALQCPGKALGACWIFNVPGGDGAGFAYSATGYQLFLQAGDQYSFNFSVASPQFQYNPPTVTSVTSSATVPGCRFPTLGVCSDKLPITLTVRGHDFGQPIEAFGETPDNSQPVVSFYRPVDVGGFATALQCADVNRVSDFLMTCTLPRGGGGGLTVRVQAIEPQWFGDSTPGFSYDAPVITEAYAAIRDIRLPAPPCYNVTIETYNNQLNATIFSPSPTCPPAPARLTVLTAGQLNTRALQFNLPNGLAATTATWIETYGGVANNGSFAGLAASPHAQATGALLSGPTLESVTPAGGGAAQYYTYITLYGSNFGDAAPGLNCPLMAWAYRAATGNDPAVCDGMENFLGEGEVDSSITGGRILHWNNTMVVFIAPSGIGLKDVDLNVRGNSIALPPGDPRRVRFQYMAPIITSVTPTSIDANGGTFVELTGWNFGVDQWKANNIGMSISNAASFKVPLSSAPSLPTASIRIQLSADPNFGPQCVSGALRLDGTVSPYVLPPVAHCLTGMSYAVTAGQTTLTFYAPPGVGAKRNLTVVIVDGPAVNPRISNTSLPYTIISSDPTPISYLPPVITGPEKPYALINGSDTGMTDPFQIIGFQFGPSSIDTPPAGLNWSSTDQQIKVLLNNVTCDGAKRLTVTSSIQSVIQCTPDANSVVGTGYMNLSIAQQQVAMVANTLTIACGRGFFGRPGETCSPCVLPGLPLMNVLAVPGVPGTPSVVCNGYAPSIPQDQTCFMNASQRAYVASIAPLTASMLNSTNLPVSYLSANMSVFTSLVSSPNTQYNGIGSQICPTFPYPAPRPGYYNLNGSMASQCPPGLAYPNRDLCIAPCPDDMCDADNICMPGYASLPPHFRCSSCAPAGYSGPGSPAYFWRGGVCVACPSGYQGIIIGYIVGIALVALISYITQRWGLHICSASIGIDFFQVVALFGTSKVTWPAPMQMLLTILSAFYANVEIVAPECLDPTATFITKFSGIVLLPVVFAAVLLVVHATLLFSKRVVMGRHNEVNRHAHTLVGAGLVLMYFLYIYETRTVLAVFDCAPLVPSDGLEYMAAAPLEECDVTAKGVYAKLLIPSIVGIVVYIAAYPLVTLAIMWRQRETIMEDQLLRAKGVGDDRLTNPHAYELRKRYSSLYASFTPDAFYWLFIILMRKFLIALSIVVFNHNASFQMAACLMVLMCAYGLQVRNAPYLSPANHELVLRSHAESSFTSAIHARIRASIAGVESRGRKKTHRNLMDSTGRIDRSALVGLLTSWLFDPNTLEAALLFAAALVALMGIMFESEALQSSQYASAQSAVTDVAMAVIVLGILCECRRRCGRLPQSCAHARASSSVTLIAAPTTSLRLTLHRTPQTTSLSCLPRSGPSGTPSSARPHCSSAAARPRARARTACPASPRAAAAAGSTPPLASRTRTHAETALSTPASSTLHSTRSSSTAPRPSGSWRRPRRRWTPCATSSTRRRRWTCGASSRRRTRTCTARQPRWRPSSPRPRLTWSARRVTRPPDLRPVGLASGRGPSSTRSPLRASPSMVRSLRLLQ